MVDRKDPLPVARQCALLGLPRSTFYHVPKPVSDEELALMALIDRCHLKHPFYGSRRIRDWLEDQGHRVNRKKVQRLMRTMDLTAQYPKRNRSLVNSADQRHGIAPILSLLFREIGYAGQAFEMIVGRNKFDIVFSGAGVDDGIGKGELVR